MVEEEEVLFFEDRRPGNVSPVGSKRRNETASMSQDFLRFDNSERTDSPASPDCEIKMLSKNCLMFDEADKGNTKEKESNKDTAGDEPDEDILFVEEDRNPILSGQETSSPRYSINETFIKLLEKKEPEAKRNKFSNTCWNCGKTDHALRDCPTPRNHAQIARCRREFQEAKGSPPVYKRYHVEEGQVFGHLVPGELSKNLRRALGIESRQLPLHIYNMRRLGYPPGWLQEAKVSHSGIIMFDGQGNEVNDPDTEAGEVVEEGSKDKYDIHKIVRYPGFNVPPPPDTYDDSSYWRCPPQSRNQSLETMLTRLEGRIVGGYKRKKLSLVAATSDMEDSNESHEMEYEETPEEPELPEDNCKFVPSLPDEDLPPPPPLELPEEPSNTDSQSQNLLSSSVEETSLTELEEAKKHLLAQLNDTTATCGTPESRVGKIKSMDLGTPLLKSVSPYARLPSAEKFSVNICDVINFENLPDSTGKYKKMSGIIHKVRVKLSKINDET